MSGNEQIDKMVPEFRRSVDVGFYTLPHDQRLEIARTYLGVGEDADGIRQASYLVSTLDRERFLEAANRAAIPAIMVRNRCYSLGSKLARKT